MRSLILTAFLMGCAAACAATVDTFVLTSAATSTGAKSAIAVGRGAKTFQASMTVTSGSGTGAVTIEASVNGSVWDSIGTLSVTDSASDSITALAPTYTFYRANVTGLTGTGAAITVNGGN